MAEREVSYRLTAAPSSGVDEPLKRVAKEARAAAAEVAKAEVALKKMASATYAVQAVADRPGDTYKAQAAQKGPSSSEMDALIQRADRKAAAVKAGRDAAAAAAQAERDAEQAGRLGALRAADRQRAAQERSDAVDQARREARPPPGGGGGRFGGLRGLGGMMGGGMGFGGMAHAAWPLAALAAGTKGLDLAQHGGPMGEGAFSRGQFSADKAKESLVWESGKLPIFGTLLKLSNQFEALAERVRRVADAEDALHRTEQRIAVERSFIARRTQLGDEQSRAEARLKFGSSSMGQQFAIGTQSQYAVEQAQARIAGGGPAGGFGRPAGVPGPGDQARGTGRQERQADVAARMGHEAALGKMRVEQGRELNILDAGRARTAEVVAEKEKKVADARGQVAAARKQLEADNAAKNASVDKPWYVKLDEALPFGGKSDKSTGKDEDSLKLAASRANLQRETLNLQEREKELEAALDRQRQESLARGDTLLEQGRARLGLLEQERERLTGIVRQERDRIQSAKEQFGMQSPLVRQSLVALSRKVKAGHELNERELQFASEQGGELWRPTVQKAAAKRAEASGFGEEVKNLDAEARGKDAEAGRKELDPRILAEIEKTKGQVNDVLLKDVIPQIKQAVTEVTLFLKVALEQMRRELQNERKAAAGGL